MALAASARRSASVARRRRLRNDPRSRRGRARDRVDPGGVGTRDCRTAARAPALAEWWGAFDDPLVARSSPRRRGEPDRRRRGGADREARARRAAAGAALLPRSTPGVSASRGRQDVTIPTGTAVARRSARAGSSTCSAAIGPAETRPRASRGDRRPRGTTRGSPSPPRRRPAYTQLRSCEARLAQARLDAASRARPHASQTRDRRRLRVARQRRARPRLGGAGADPRRATGAGVLGASKALVALSAIGEPELRQALGAARPGAAAAGIDVVSVPASALAQRPDVTRRRARSRRRR